VTGGTFEQHNTHVAKAVARDARDLEDQKLTS
jgi:hypothetical protein